MKWERMMEKYGWKQADVGAEPFQPLGALAAQAHAAGKPVARVSMNVGTSYDYGQVKVSCNVTIDCPQDEGTIQFAGEAAFMKALEMTNEGCVYLGIPPMREPS